VMVAFNRTILELKQPQSYWSRYWCRSFNRTILELKRKQTHLSPSQHRTFNRTILELKLSSVTNILFSFALLIVPYWN